MEHSSYLRSNDSAISVKKQKRIFKIIVIGDSSVGKTCLTLRFCGGEFPTKTEATIGMDFREREVMIDDEKITLQLWDTAGQERFRKSMVPHYYRNVHAVVFVYDVTKMTSFRNLSAWIEECDENRMSSNDVARILVGNKCDCKDRKAVNTTMAQKFADMYQMPLFETSAKDDAEADNIEAIFLTLAHKLKSSKPLMTRTGSQYGRPNSGVVKLTGSDAKKKDDEDRWCCLF